MFFVVHFWFCTDECRFALYETDLYTWSEGRWFEACVYRRVVPLGKKPFPHCLSSRRCINRHRRQNSGLTLRWNSILSRGEVILLVGLCNGSWVKLRPSEPPVPCVPHVRLQLLAYIRKAYA